MRRGIVWATCLALCTVGVHAQSARQILDLTNQDRVAQGLQPLHWNAALATAAQTHAERMAGEGNLSHQYAGEASLMKRAAQAGAHFQAIAENIATGYSENAIESEWMHSTPHRTNILDPRMNAIGVGVVERRGTLYAVEDFADAAEQLSSAQVEHRVAGLLQSINIDASAPRSAAAQICAAGPIPPGGRLVVRFDTPDLSRLPDQAAAQIRSGSYHRASVAVCPQAGGPNSFTTYSVAIVLY